MLHNKREAGIVKARQERIWLQTRRHSSAPSPGDQVFLRFVVLMAVGTGFHLQPMWEDEMHYSGEQEWKERGCREILFCAAPEGYWEGVKCQSALIVFLPTCVVKMPATLLTFPQCLV